MRECKDPQKAELHYVDTLHTAMNPFMQRCMEIYWDNLFDNGTLLYTPVDNKEKVIEGSAAVTLNFKDGKFSAFDLSTCGNTGEYLVITTSMDRFFKVKEENKDKTVIGIMPCYRILQEIKNSRNHPLFPLMANLDPDKAPVVFPTPARP